MGEHLVAIYARVGTKEQTMQTSAIQQQKQELERFAQAQNMKVVGRYYDIGYSGCDKNRSCLKKILADGEKKLFYSVLVTKQSKLYRGSFLAAPKWPFNVITKNQRSRTRER